MAAGSKRTRFVTANHILVLLTPVRRSLPSPPTDWADRVGQPNFQPARNRKEVLSVTELLAEWEELIVVVKEECQGESFSEFVSDSVFEIALMGMEPVWFHLHLPA